MKLHVGCGPRILEGWINLDIAPVDGAIHGSGLDLHFADGTVSRIYCEDLFEHFDQKDQLKFLSECHRLLEPGGLARITFPELRASLKREEDPWAWGHLLIPTLGYFAEIASMSGFQVYFDGRNSGVVEGFPSDLRPFAPRHEDENIFATLRKSIS